MNVNHYVRCLTLGLAPHCDPNLVTVLMASGAEGGSTSTPCPARSSSTSDIRWR
jgi:hypothetical protein